MKHTASARRLPYWDNLKGLLIFLVVFGHILERILGGRDSFLYKAVYLFHMPLFIFCSGYLSAFSPKKILSSAVWFSPI